MKEIIRILLVEDHLIARIGIGAIIGLQTDGNGDVAAASRTANAAAKLFLLRPRLFICQKRFFKRSVSRLSAEEKLE